MVPAPTRGLSADSALNDPDGEDEGVIRFSIAGIPVTVRPSFWLVALLLGWGVASRTLLVAWVVVVFVSVLAHELGHAITARRFGAGVSITLTTLGGFTRWEKPGDGMTPGRRAVVAAAGSAVGIVLGLAVLGAFMATRPWGTTAASVVLMIAWVNVGWGVLNWLPIRPLDGGHLVLALLDMVAPRRTEGIASAIFLVTSLAALAAGIYFQFYFAAILAGFMAWAEISRLVGPSPRPRPAPPAPPGNLFDLEPPSPAPEEGTRSGE